MTRIITKNSKGEKSMFEKRKLKKAIEDSKKKIELIEKKRTRSQSAIVDAILRHVEPDDVDVDYFNQFTAQIEDERENLHSLVGRLEALG